MIKGIMEFLDVETEKTEATRDLVLWSLNFDIKSTSTPYQLFLDLIGYSVDTLGIQLVTSHCNVPLGYVELDKLGKALSEYSDYPQEVLDWIERLAEIELGANDV